MKKRLLSLLLVCILFLLAGCGSTGGADIQTDPVPTTEITVSPDPIETDTHAVTEETVTTTPSSSLPEDSTFEIHFIDVGQASAALVICDGQAMVIDAGDTDASSLMYSYLQSHDIDYLDYLVITHGHADHVGGAAGILNYAEVGTAFCSVTEYDSKAFQNFVKYLDKQNKTITVPSAGDTFMLGSALVEIYGPVYPSDEPNNMSIVLRITYGETRFLFSGDAETDAENAVLDAGYDIDCDLIVVGHHGSNTSTGYRWLREASPEYGIISCGAGNEYGHPTEETLSKLRDASVTTFRTDMQGDIICCSDGTNLTFQVSRNVDADTLSGAGAGGNHADATVPATDAEATEAEEDREKVTYIVNINTGKFHEPSCSSVEAMAEKNKRESTESRDELIAKGYSPCGRCKP